MFKIHQPRNFSQRLLRFARGGEEIFARPHDDPNGPLRACRVTKLYHNPPKPIWKATFDNGLIVEATLEHPFFVPKKSWISLRDLQVGDSCVNVDGEEVRVVSKEFVTEDEPVYNFEVEDAHTYFVGTSRVQSVLVHNQCAKHQVTGCPACQADSDFNSPFVTYITVDGTPASETVFEKGSPYTFQHNIGSFETFLREKGDKAVIRIVDENSVPSFGSTGIKFKIFKFNLGGGILVGGGDLKFNNATNSAKLVITGHVSDALSDAYIPVSVGYTYENEYVTTNASITVTPAGFGSFEAEKVHIGSDIRTKIGKHVEIKIGAGASYDFKDKKPGYGGSIGIGINR